MIEFLFWASFTIIIYTYAVYPLLVWIIAGVYKIHGRKERIEPDVSVVMAVRNEECRIRARLENLLHQDYPVDRLEIIVVSDGSTDTTAEIVRQYDKMKVSLIELPDWHGKAAALNLGISKAKGSIIVFADARQTFAPDAISELVANFADPDVGCVSGELVFRDSSSSIQLEMGGYWRYEKWLRNNESLSGSVVGATGAIYAIRKELYRSLPDGAILDDVLTPLNIIRQGYRCIFDGQAMAYDILSQTTAQEWQRKVRTLAGNWQLISLNPAIFSLKSNPILWRFVSHKVLRLIVPFALVILFLSGAALSAWSYQVATLAQLFIYCLAMAGWLLPETRRVRLITTSYFFVAMNLAVLFGLWSWLNGSCESMWKPACPGR